MFNLQSDSNSCLIWRDQRTRYHPANIRKKDLYEGGSLCAWYGINLDGHTDLPRGTANAHIYRNPILHAYTRSNADAIGKIFPLQDNNGQFED